MIIDKTSSSILIWKWYNQNPLINLLKISHLIEKNVMVSLGIVPYQVLEIIK